MFKNKLSFFVVLFVLLSTTGASCISFSNQSQGVKGMFMTEDKGENWKSISAYPTVQGVKNISGVSVYTVVRDPGDVNTLYLGSRGQGLYYTYDSGASWHAVSAMNGKFIYSIVVDPKDKCNIYITDGLHIYKSEDCARSWVLSFTEERTNLRMTDLAIDYTNPNIIYGSQLNGDLIKSQDGGKSWLVVKRFGFDIRNIVSDPNQKDRIYVAGRSDGLYRSDDAGKTWKNLSDDFKDYSKSQSYYRLILNPAQKGHLYWVSKYGILHSVDAGETWTDVKLLTSPGSVDIYSFAVNPKNSKEIYYTGTVLNDKSQNIRSTFYKSVDGGNNWVTRKLPSNTIPVYLSVHPKNGNVIFAGFANFD